MAKFKAHERVIDELQEQGLVAREGDSVKVTPEGDAYTRALIARCRAHNKPNSYIRDGRK